LIIVVADGEVQVRVGEGVGPLKGVAQDGGLPFRLCFLEVKEGGREGGREGAFERF